MVQKSHPWGVIWVPSNRPQIGHLSEKNDNLAVQYEDVHGLAKVTSLKTDDIKDGLKPEQQDLFNWYLHSTGVNA